MPVQPPTVREAFGRTVRFVSTARLRDSVLGQLVDAVGELVHGVPHARFINPSFAYAKPREPNRFNGADRGAWYAALAVETCVAEVEFRALADVGDFHAVVAYAEMFASMAGESVDLREILRDLSLDPNSAVGYPAGNALALATRRQG